MSIVVATPPGEQMRASGMLTADSTFHKRRFLERIRTLRFALRTLLFRFERSPKALPQRGIFSHLAANVPFSEASSRRMTRAYKLGKKTALIPAQRDSNYMNSAKNRVELFMTCEPYPTVQSRKSGFFPAFDVLVMNGAYLVIDA